MAPAEAFHEILSQLFQHVLGAAERPVGVGGGSGNTVTAVHVRLQLFPSFDSAIVPTKDALLSAQART